MTRRFSFARVQGRLPEAVGNAKVRWQDREAVHVQYAPDDPERSGFGEAAPLPGYSRDGLEQVVEALQGLAEARVDTEGDEAASFTLPSLQLPSARFAVETAIADHRCKAEAEPVAGWWARVAGLARPQVRVEVNGLVSAAEPEAALAEARAQVEAGLRHLKLKVGRPGAFEAELELAQILKASLPAGGTLRVDANRAFGAQGLIRRLEALAKAGVDLVEEPAPLDVVEALEGSPVPLALDESLHAPRVRGRAVQLVRRGLVTCVVLKPAAFGGVGDALWWSGRAREAGASVSVSHLFDGAISHRAYCALALAIGSGPHGLAHHPGLVALPGPRPWPVVGGHIELSDRPGFEPPEAP